jgi:hypothetical protein
MGSRPDPAQLARAERPGSSPDGQRLQRRAASFDLFGAGDAPARRPRQIDEEVLWTLEPPWRLADRRGKRELNQQQIPRCEPLRDDTRLGIGSDWVSTVFRAVGQFEMQAALQFEKSYWSEGKAKSNPL